VTGEDLRRVVLETINTHVGTDGAASSRNILAHAAKTLEISGTAQEQALLAFFYDLFRTGYLSWGKNLSDSDPPWFHLTQQGREALKNISRDPANPDGYLANLAACGGLNPVAESYIREALATYAAACFKATAVMVGVAAESLVLELRDSVGSRLDALEMERPADIDDWRIKRVLDSLEGLLAAQKQSMPRPLFEAFESYWPAFTQQVRAARNAAGHPTSIDPIEESTVHASLLIFPELLRFSSDLEAWIPTGYI